MNTVCEIDNKEKEAKIRFLDENEKEKEKHQQGSLGEWQSTETLLKLAPERPYASAVSLPFDRA
jgi:hypothetical protein